MTWTELQEHVEARLGGRIRHWSTVVHRVLGPSRESPRAYGIDDEERVLVYLRASRLGMVRPGDAARAVPEGHRPGWLYRTSWAAWGWTADPAAALEAPIGTVIPVHLDCDCR